MPICRKPEMNVLLQSQIGKLIYVSFFDICQTISIRARDYVNQISVDTTIEKGQTFQRDMVISCPAKVDEQKKISIIIKLVCTCKKTRVDNSNTFSPFSLSVPSLYFQGYHCFIKHGMNANEMPNIVHINFNFLC